MVGYEKKNLVVFGHKILTELFKKVLTDNHYKTIYRPVRSECLRVYLHLRFSQLLRLRCTVLFPPVIGSTIVITMR